MLVIVPEGIMNTMKATKVQKALARAKKVQLKIDQYIRKETDGACKGIETKERRSVGISEKGMIRKELEHAYRYGELLNIKHTLAWVLGESDLSPLDSYDDW
jgi:hypothetical protein